MAELKTLARPYAKAVFEYADGAGELTEWSNSLAVSAAVSQQDAMQATLANPSLTAAQKAEAFIAVCGDAISTKVNNLLNVLAENKRLALLPEITALFELFKSQREKAVDVRVETAFEMSGDLEAKLAKALSAKLDREVTVQSSVDQSLLGGVVVRAGDTVIDGSVRGRLAKLAEAMNS
ncbi:MAG: F0F1 ATP synthase subunit delta [Cellvibrionaceae bacterium]|nr:F0F1 ATP synthase subunit delta [Cellvibrionaceae bacterium]